MTSPVPISDMQSDPVTRISIEINCSVGRNQEVVDKIYEALAMNLIKDAEGRIVSLNRDFSYKSYNERRVMYLYEDGTTEISDWKLSSPFDS